MDSALQRHALELAVRATVERILHDLRSSLFGLTATLEARESISASDYKVFHESLAALVERLSDARTGLELDFERSSVGEVLDQGIAYGRSISGNAPAELWTQLERQLPPATREIELDRRAMAVALGLLFDDAARSSSSVELVVGGTSAHVAIRVVADVGWHVCSASCAVAQEIILAHGGSLLTQPSESQMSVEILIPDQDVARSSGPE